MLRSVGGTSSCSASVKAKVCYLKRCVGGGIWSTQSHQRVYPPLRGFMLRKSGTDVNLLLYFKGGVSWNILMSSLSWNHLCPKEQMVPYFFPSVPQEACFFDVDGNWCGNHEGGPGKAKISHSKLPANPGPLLNCYFHVTEFFSF